MADSSSFPPGTLFTSTVELPSDAESAYGTVQVSFDPSEYPEKHTITVADIAAIVRDLFTSHGYQVAPFEAPVTSSALLDWPQEA